MSERFIHCPDARAGAQSHIFLNGQEYHMNELPFPFEVAFLMDKIVQSSL